MFGAVERKLRHQVLAGVAWSGFGNYGSAVIRFLTIAVLAWLLPPSDFGLLGLAVAFLLFSEGFSEMGLVGALVRRDKAEEPTLSTAFWMNLAVSSLLAGLTAWLATPIMAAFGDASAAPLLRLLALCLPITGLSAVPRALLSRDLAFRQISTIQLAGELAFGAVGVGMAAAGLGVWSLAGAVLAQRSLSAAVFWFAAAWRPSFSFSAAARNSLLTFGGPFMVGAVLNRGLGNLDYVIVGRWLGTEALGFYSLAFQLSATPMNRLVGILQRVAFPALSRLQSDLPRMRKGFIEGMYYVFSVTVPCALFVALLGPLFIDAAYGAKWAASKGSLQVLALGGLFCSLDVAHSVYFALGKPQIRLWLVASRILLFVILVAGLGVGRGIEGVALCLGGAYLVSGILSLKVAARLLDLRVAQFTKALWPSLRAAAVASIPALWLIWRPSEALGPWSLLFLLCALMSCLYLIGILPLLRKLDWRSLTRGRH